MIIFPAMGVAASYYEPLALHLAEQGIACITADLRGLGHSSLRPSRHCNYGYEEMIQLDYLAIFKNIAQKFPQRKKYIIGHSLGGQLAALFLSRHDFGVQGLILIASCSVHPSGWQGWGAWRVWFALRFFALITKTLGYFPGDQVGFGGLAARQHLLDWCQQGRTGQYRPAGSDFDYEAALGQLQIPTLAISIEGDDFAPAAAMKNLYGKFHPAAPVKTVVYTKAAADDPRLNHFNWARKPQGIAQLLAEWTKPE